MSVDIGAVQKLSSPNSFALVSSRKPDGSTNLMALSWWTYVSNRPPTVCIALSSRGYTQELIGDSGEFAVSLVGESLRDKAFQCGTCSGRDSHKAHAFDIPLRDAQAIALQVPADSRAVLECRETNRVEAGDHWLIIGEVAATTQDPGVAHLYAWNGYSRLGTVNP